MPPSRRVRLSAALLAVVLAGSAMPGAVTSLNAQVAVDYIDRLGFTDARHTRADGYQSSTVVDISEPGYTLGLSQRFASSSHADQSAWMGSPLGGAKSIGFYDAAHTADIGRHFSRIVKLSNNGRAIGLSARYDGGSPQTGRTAWLASWGGGTRRIGLYADDPIPLPGVAYFNDVFDLNEAGQAIGVAPFPDGQYAWISNIDGTTRAIGLMDAEYMSPGRSPFNTPVALNPSGTVVGNTEWSGGQAAWLQSKHADVPPRVIGLYDAAHTLTDGRIVNAVRVLNDHGYAAGSTEHDEVSGDTTYTYHDAWVSAPDGSTVQLAQGVPLFITNSNLVAGEDDFYLNPGYPWIYDINTDTLRFLFEDDGSGDGALLFGLTEDGVATGSTSTNFSASYSSWLAPAGQRPVMIGIYDIEHDGGLGKSVYASSIVAMAANGLTIGTSEQMQVEGTTAWIANPVTAATYRIGLYDGLYMGAAQEVEVGGNPRTFVSHTSIPTHVTSSRFVAGYSVRYHHDDTAEGQTAWVYNSPQRTYAMFVFSVRPSDGYAFSEVHALLENGIAVGTYTKFADDGTDLGDRAFVWVTGKGAYDLASVLDVDPEAVGWDYLASGIVVNEDGVIAGHGVPFDSTSQGVFLSKLR